MVSNMLSDRIERFILNQLKNQTTPVVILKRKEVAELLDCAPSQVTYVINTRFSPDRRFQVESRRGSGGFIRISIRTENLTAKKEKKTAGEKDPDSLMEQYFQMLVSSGTITMREFLMMQGLMDIIMEHCPAERKHSAVKDAVHRISRIIKEGK